MTQARPISADAMTLMTYRALPVPAMIALRFAAVVTTWAARRRTRIALAALEPILDVLVSQRHPRMSLCLTFARAVISDTIFSLLSMISSMPVSNSRSESDPLSLLTSGALLQKSMMSIVS